MSIRSKITNDLEGANSATFEFVSDPQEQIIQMDIRLETTPHRNESAEGPRYEVITATLEEIIWLRNALNEAIREVVGL